MIENYWRNNKQEFAGDRRSKIIYNLSKKYLGEKALDVGAGSGALIRLIEGAVGIDLVENEIVGKGDITNLRFDNFRFDTVFATEVLEHLSEENLSKGLSEIWRVLKKNGHFILTVPYKEDLNKSMVTCPKCEFGFHRWQHLHSFNEEKIKRTLYPHGFKIVDIKIKPFSLYERGFKWKLLSPLILRFHKDVSKTMFVVAKKI